MSSMSHRRDTERAQHLLCSYQAKLCAPEQQKLRDSLQEVTCMLRGDLFQALLDIQEYYGVMLNSAQCDVIKSPNLDTSPVDLQNVWKSGNGDEWTPDLEPQCVRVIGKMTDLKETTHTLLNPLHTTLPKVRLHRY